MGDAAPEKIVDDTDPARAPRPKQTGDETAAEREGSASGSADEHHRHHHIPHPHLIEPGEDRWKWRAKIRRNPHQLFLYRIGVMVAGLALMVAAVITGPLPGPGGIPLFLLGLAVWASEFEWAHRVMLCFKRQLHRYRQWPRRRKVLFWVVFLGVCGVAWYTSMLLAGVPGWMPGPVANYLRILPGVD